MPNYPETENRLLGTLGCLAITENQNKCKQDPHTFDPQNEQFKDLYPVFETAFNLKTPLTSFVPAHDYADALVCEKFEGLKD